jgi:hypothetical protein
VDTSAVLPVHKTRLTRPAPSILFAAYVVLEDAWYILPAAKVQGRGTVCLFSKSKSARYEDYLEAWPLLREASESSHPESSAEQAPVAQEAAFPRSSAAGRMEAAANYFKRRVGPTLL